LITHNKAMNSRALKWTNLVVFFATIGMNMVAVLLPLAGRSTREVSERFEHLFTPASYTFSVWSVIYTLLLVNAIDALRRSDPEPATVDRARAFLIGANVLNTVWLVAWHNLWIGLSVPIMLGILACLIAAYANLERAPLTGWAHYAQRAPIAAYLGWISVATIANTGNLLVAQGWRLEFLEPSVWAMLLALVAGGLGFALSRTQGGLFYCATLAWGLIGVINRPSSGEALIGLYIGLGLIALGVLSRFLKPARPALTRRGNVL
jgi:translocator protein